MRDRGKWTSEGLRSTASVVQPVSSEGFAPEKLACHARQAEAGFPARYSTAMVKPGSKPVYKASSTVLVQGTPIHPLSQNASSGSQLCLSACTTHLVSNPTTVVTPLSFMNSAHSCTAINASHGGAVAMSKSHEAICDATRVATDTIWPQIVAEHECPGDALNSFNALKSS